MRHIILRTGETLRAKLDSASTTTQPVFTSHYYDSDSTDISEQNDYNDFNGVSYVTLVGVPTSPATRRVVTEISLYNADTITHTFQLEIFDGTDGYIIFRIAVEPFNTIFLSGNVINLATAGVLSVNGETGVVSLGWDDLNDVPDYLLDGYQYVLVSQSGVNTWEPYISSGGGETLAQTLAIGNVTGGEDIEVTNTDSVYFPDSIRTLFTFDGGFSASKVAGVINWIVSALTVTTTGALQVFQAIDSGIVRLGGTGLNSRLQLFKTSGFNTEHDVTEITANRTFKYPDGNVDFTGGIDGQVLTVQADGSYIPETPASGVTDHALLSNLSWEISGHTSYLPETLAGFDAYGEAIEYPIEDFIQSGDTILDGLTGLIQTVTATTFTPMIRAPFSGTITAVGGVVSVGTCDIRVGINGTPLGVVTGISSTYAEEVHAASNTFVVNDIITLVISNLATDPEDLDFVIKMTRTI